MKNFNQSNIMLSIILVTALSLVGTSVTYGENVHGYDLMDEANCLASAVYHEAGNQSSYGQLWVMNTIRNRTIDPRWPDSFCKVVQQPNQFSGFNSRRYLVYQKEMDAIYEVAIRFVARRIPDITVGVDHYFNPDIAQPANHRWIRDCLAGKEWGTLVVRAKVGDHVFCGPPLKKFHE